MAFYPGEMMPKHLMRESLNEVDGNPSIYNARDYNIHHREILSIQHIIGKALATMPEAKDVISGIQGNSDIMSTILRILSILDLIQNKGYVGQYAGTLSPGTQLKIPSIFPVTQTSGEVGTGDTTINVVSTEGFPSQGIITKFNGLSPTEICLDSSGSLTPPGDGSRCASGTKRISYDGLTTHGSSITNQEIISYTSKTSTSFNGCTRGISGSTTQIATGLLPAVIMCGRSAVSFGHNLWITPAEASQQIYVYHDAMLKVHAGVLANGSLARLGEDISSQMEVAWTLIVNGHFADVNVNQIFGNRE
jgi:hypothetical protein